MPIVDFSKRKDRYGKYSGALNTDIPQVASPAAISSEMSQEEQRKVVPPTVVPTELNPHAGVDDSVNMPERDDYHFYTDLVNSYIKQPMTPEEEERRKRSATAVEGIGHLGNVLNSFSNLVFTGQGAPSQTLPTVPAGNLQKFEDRVAENRRRYIGARMDADARDRSVWLDDWRNEYQRQKDEADKRAKLDERAYDLMKFNANLSKEQAREQARKELEEARLKETERHNKAMENISWSRANAGNKSNGNNSVEKKYGSYHFRTKRDKVSREFDMNKDEDVLQMYKEGVRGGIWPEIISKDESGRVSYPNVEDIRNYIIYNVGPQKPKKDTSEMQSLVESPQDQRVSRDKTAPYKRNSNDNKAPYLK